MRLMISVSDARTGSASDVLLEAEESAALTEIVPKLAAAVGADPGGSALALLVDGRVVPMTEPLTTAGMREGSSVVIGPRAALAAWETTPEDALVQFRIVSGEGAGTTLHAWRGIVTIGSSPDAALRIDDRSRIAPIELVVDIAGADSVTVRPAGAETAATLDGDEIAASVATAWPAGGQISIAGRLIELARPDDDLAAFVPSEQGGGIDYNRPPRILPPETSTSLRLPAPPRDQKARPLPILAAILPLVIAGASALLLKNYYFLLIAALSPVTIVANYLTDKRTGKKSRRTEAAEYRTHKAVIESDAAAALVAERAELLRNAPDPAELAEIATRPLPRLWERRNSDPDHLRIRVGTATQPSRVTLDDPEQLEHRRTVTWDARDAPAVFQLGERGVVGIAGWGDRPRRLAQWAVAQLAVLQSPRDVQLYLLTDASGQKPWHWMSWLPHVQPAFGQETMTTLGVTASSTARRIAELVALLDARQESAGNGGGQWTGSEVVVVIDGARRMRSMPGLVRVLKEGPSVGIYSLCVDSDERLLPEECTAVVIADAEGLVIRQQRVDVLKGIRPDLIDDDWLDWVARGIAPIHDASPEEGDGSIPNSSRLLDVLHLDPPTADAVAAGWQRSPRSTVAVVGESIDGAFSIDLSVDGPHALIAGTTGSGKSELLQTLVASLAVANRPDEMNFVLVDYKGGAAFKDCVDLPHTVGMVTDLDTHLVERALESLGAELRRREHLLAAAGAKDLPDYLDLRARQATLAPIPRLAIVIDEFASLARELPDFVHGLVNIAQRGRSLGIHLILATQRPSGVVSPEIRANTNLRIALRVTDASESTDVIDAPDAARISKSTPGRAYVRLGASSLVPFQAGRVGGRRPGTPSTSNGRDAGAEPLIRTMTLAELADPAPTAARAEATRSEAGDTDLRALVAAIRGAAERLGIAEQPEPWLPALPDEVTIESLVRAFGADPAAFSYGIEDHPSQQLQKPALIDLDVFGHLFVIGAPRSGRSQTLRTIAGVGAARVRASDLHIYGIDCGNGALLPLADFPHSGAIAQRHQVDRVQRLLARLLAEVATRQGVLSSGGFADLAEQRRAAVDGAAGAAARLPHILLLIDLWEGFLTSLGTVDDGALVDQVQFLLREGASVGIHLIITGDRQLLSGRISTLVDSKLMLRLTERSDYSLANLNPRKLPEDIPPGRAFRSENAVELQIALLAPDPSGAAQAAALREIAARATSRDAGLEASRRPFRLDALPTTLTLADALARTGDEQRAAGWALVGVGGDELRGHGVNLFEGVPTFVVAGPAKSGRSTVLATMARTLLDGGASIVVLAPRPSPLRALEGTSGVAAVLTGSELTEAELAPLFDGATKRVLIVDDGELLRDVAAKDWLKDLVRGARDRGVGIVLGGDSSQVAGGFSGWQVEIRKNRSGILLSPQSISDGELVGARLSRSSLSTGVQPGRGLANLGDGELTLLQLPD
ncbi:MAG TPA: FtsK/SpoIIIE domain-containing protein [Pseudolysinimonas sp.]|jgi:S-DNA-T family DNA segregation ATPase FtsK/SpoIIIE